jgi:crotonobetainyl-CoA:carnitine CoA-transferase CaiB-like acyl-CoA transferase
MAPHGIFPTNSLDTWISLACRNDDDWTQLRALIDDPAGFDSNYDTLEGRYAHQNSLEELVSSWTLVNSQTELASRLTSLGIPNAPVRDPQQRIDQDENTADWGLWPTVEHTQMGSVRVDGLPVHLSETDWNLERGAGCLGEHNDEVYGELLGFSSTKLKDLKSQGII